MDIVYPIEINVNNINAIYLSKNATTGNHTKHVDTRYHFIREYINKGIVEIVFVRSEDNKAGLMTKNLGNKLYAKHMKGMFEVWVYYLLFDIDVYHDDSQEGCQKYVHHPDTH